MLASIGRPRDQIPLRGSIYSPASAPREPGTVGTWVPFGDQVSPCYFHQRTLRIFVRTVRAIVLNVRAYTGEATPPVTSSRSGAAIV